MGPLTLADLVGLDVCVAVMDVLWEEFRDPRYAATPLLRRMVSAGMLGRKSGQGFYDHSGADNPAEDPPDGRIAQIVRNRERDFDLADLLLDAHIDDAMRMISDAYASERDVDTAMRFGCGYPKGPTELLEERGATRVAVTLHNAAALGLRGSRAPAPLLTDLLPRPVREG